MSLKVVSWPESLKTWKPTDPQQYFYFELVGETCPAFDESQGELAATPKPDAGGVTGTRVYEYVWTIGRLGVWQHRPKTPQGLAHRSRGDEAFSDLAPEVTPSESAEKFWVELEDPAAHVYVYFPLAERWRVSELGATVKYLSPMPNDETFLDKTAKDVEALLPIVGAVGQLANVAAPGAGAVISSSARVIGALAQMKTNSLPQTAGFPWAVAKATFIWTRMEGGEEKKTPMAGVAWSLPKTMFEELGGRISGSVAVIFVPVTAQQDQGTEAEPQATEAEPQATEAEPQATEAEPQGTTVEPQATEAEPQATEAEPQATEAEPQGTTVEPQATTVEPQATKAETKDTKAEPSAPPILARAIVHGPHPIWSPPKDRDDGFIKLKVTPQPPKGSQTTSGP
jgi:hypothetical protein